jgi:hypothetical protein
MPLSIAVDFDWADEHLSAFRTYMHYVRSFDHLICHYHGDGTTVDYPRLAAAVRSTPACAQMQIRHREPGLYEKELRNGWFTEVALNIPTILNEPDLIPYSNHWGTVMAYYVVHHGARAAIAVRDGGLPERPGHDWLLRQIGNMAAQRRAFPPPWGVICQGHQQALNYVGLPEGIDATCPSLLSQFQPEHAWPSFCKALSTTRNRAIERAVAEWRRHERKSRIPRAARLYVGEGVPATTIFHFLFRLRLRSNYMDADAFATAAGLPKQAHIFNRCLTNVVSSSMMVWETIICTMVGVDELARLATRAIQVMPAAASTVGQRMAAWQTACQRST